MLRERLKCMIAGAAGGAVGGLALAAALSGALSAGLASLAGAASSLVAWAGGVLTAAATKAVSMITGMVTSQAAATFMRYAAAGAMADYGIQRLIQGKGENDIDWGSVFHSAVKGGLFGNWVVTLGASQYVAPYLTNFGTRFVWYATGGAAINSGMAAITGQPRRGERTIFNAIVDGFSGFAPEFYVLSDGLVSEVTSKYESLLFGEEVQPFSYTGGLTNWLQTKQH